jgi:hypothetical protein
MQCSQARELFSDHLAGQLDPAQNVSIENHARSCEACRAEIAGLRRVWSSLDALPRVETPSYFHENLMHRINVEQDKAAQRRTAWNWRALFQPRSPLFAGAALALLAVLGVGSLHVTHSSLDPLESLWRVVSPKGSDTLPAPLRPARAEWRPNGQGGGAVAIYVQAQPGTTVSVTSVNYYSGDRKHSIPQPDVEVSAEHVTTLVVPLEARPASDITLTLSSPGKKTSLETVILIESDSAPSGSH